MWLDSAGNFVTYILLSGKMDNSNSGAVFDRTGRYRYSLWRSWDALLPRVAFIMLNPSRADAKINDQTISACIGLAKQQGFGSVEVVNLFAYRTAHPSLLKAARNPIGRNNDHYVIEACGRAKTVITAWGNHGAFRQRHATIWKLLRNHDIENICCLGITKQGHPRHPLYVRRDTTLQPFVMSSEAKETSVVETASG